MSGWDQTHIPCPCGQSSDAYSINTNGWGTCYSCNKSFPPEGTVTTEPQAKKSRDLVHVEEIADLRKRRIKEDVCRKYGYGYGEYHGKRVQIAPYHDKDGNVVAQKLRFPDKSFVVTGKLPGTLFGQHLFRSTGGKRLVITEGEIDAMSVFQVLSGKYQWPVVSLPSGAAAAEKAIRDNIEFIESFEEVVLCFDMDEPGRLAASKAAELITPGKAKVASLPYKDANECLMKGDHSGLISAIWDAKVRRPDGVINAAELRAAIHDPITIGLAYPWPGLNALTYGQRPSEIVTWTAGSGIGKSAFVREVAYHLATHHGVKVGYVALEENVKRTALGFVGIHLSKPLHLPGHNVPTEDLDRAFDETLGTERFWLYDHFGSLEEDSLMSRLKYMAAMGCKFIVLDHLTIVLSGLALDSGERQAIDQTMTKLRSFAEQTGVGIHLVSHLSRPKGASKGHEDGVKPSLSELRGSHGIVQLSDFVFALQRNSADADPQSRNQTVIWVLKNRLSGETGIGTVVRYSKEDGRLREVDWIIDQEGELVIDPSEDGDPLANLSNLSGDKDDF